jgi:hypothetical protein
MVAAMARISANLRNLWRPPVEPLLPVTSPANYVPTFLPLILNEVDPALGKERNNIKAPPPFGCGAS